MLFNDFYSCVFDTFANQDLQYWLHFIFIIKKIWITFKYLSGLLITLWIWNKNGFRWPINIVVWLYLMLRHEVISITQLLPVIMPGHLLHLYILITFLFAISLSLSLLNLSSHPHFFLPLLHKNLFHSLLFDKSWIWLHIHWNDQCCKCVSTYDSTIIHNVLRSNLTI